MIVCAAIIDVKNQPIYLRSFVSQEDDVLLKFNFLAWACLDAVEERVTTRKPGEVLDSYLGLLYPTAEYKVYGYLTNSHVKIILIVDDFFPKEDLIAKVMKRLHHLYVDAVSNPFFDYKSSRLSNSFDAALSHLLETTYNVDQVAAGMQKLGVQAS